VVPFDVLTLALHDSSRNVMYLNVWDGGPWPRAPLEFGVEEVSAGWVWKHQTPLTIPDVDSEERFGPWLRCLRSYGLRSCCVLPLTTVHQRLGAVAFGSRRTRAFVAQDVGFLLRATEMIAVCLDQTLSRTTAAREKERLRLLLEVGAVHGQMSDLDDSIAFVLATLQRWAGKDFVGLYLYDEASQALRLHMSDSQLSQRMAPQGTAPLKGSLAGGAFRSRQVTVLNHSDLASMSLDSVRRGLDLGVRSLCLVPLLSSKKPIGVLKVASQRATSMATGSTTTSPSRMPPER